MPLKISKHKRWHVWNEDNQETYARDETAFMKEIEALDKRNKMADMEERINLMKQNQGIPIQPSEQKTDVNETTETAKIEADPSYMQNDEFVEEKEKEKLKDIRQLGVPIWKLKPTENPKKLWYEESLSIQRDRFGKPLEGGELEKQERKEVQMKELYDPLSHINRMREKTEPAVTARMDDYTISPEETKARLLNQPKDIQEPIIKTRHTLHEHHHHYHHKSSHGVVSSIEDSKEYQKKREKELQIQKLRAERIKRETEERDRTTKLLMKRSTSIVS